MFNLPVIIYFLFKLGVVSTAILKEYRRYAYVIILIASAVITPPDILSQLESGLMCPSVFNSMVSNEIPFYVSLKTVLNNRS